MREEGRGKREEGGFVALRRPALLLLAALVPALALGQTVSPSAVSSGDHGPLIPLPASLFPLQDTSTHANPYVRNGAIVGAVVGVVWGAHEASMAKFACTANPCDSGRKRLALEFGWGAIGGVLGAPLGALAGWIVYVGSR